jgi:hypothetical protein
MKSTILSLQEVEGLRNLQSEAEDIERKARGLIQSLADLFKREASIGGIPSFEVSPQEVGRVLATVTSKFGKGRFLLSFETRGDLIQARLILERQTFDALDRELWQRSLALPFPRIDWTMGGSPIRNDDQIFALGATVLHAIVNGPGQE